MEAANIGPGDTVLEIGPGIGVLTFKLAELAEQVIAIELEPALAGYLEREAKSRGVTNIEIIRGDALAVELPSFTKVVSNLPYNISSPLLFRLLEQDFEDGVLMFQKEFAERLLAEPGTKRRGALTLNAGYHAEFTGLIDVPAHEFHPVPQVDSIVVGLKKRPFPHEIVDIEMYLRLITIVFQHRRRTLRNGILMGFMNLPGMGGIGKEEFKSEILEIIPGDLLTLRPEAMSTVQMVELANSLSGIARTH